MASVPTDEWIIELDQHDPRSARLLAEHTIEHLISMVAFDLASAVASGTVKPMFEPSKWWSRYRRFAAVIRLDKITFDILMNGRSGYRAQFYVSLEDGRRFNRYLIDSLLPSLKLAWERTNEEPWDEALRSLRDSSAKIWPEMDDEALKGQPKLRATMWQFNCEATGACTIGMHLFCTCPPTIEVKGGWISDRSAEPWVPMGKRARDELLRCFGFT
ncbi:MULTISPECIES: hypothetical protein [unclassified Bradyrhizobium]|jgi:hypothetical protein|uniref:hypothetical protein n=1 Tax=unclassified Bradyrhizobium TaxID=2631580 RepID=UPI0010525D99|nr:MULTISPECIES: hypothetical protein [unclassified Bradyrhizobium]